MFRVPSVALLVEGVSVHPVHGNPERAFQEPSENHTGFLEARPGVYVSRVPKISLQ